MDKNATVVGERVDKIAGGLVNSLNDLTEITRGRVFNLSVYNESRINDIMNLQIKKKNLARERWEGILNGLANERGAWGQYDDLDEDDEEDEEDEEDVGEEDKIIMKLIRKKRKMKFSRYVCQVREVVRK